MRTLARVACDLTARKLMMNFIQSRSLVSALGDGPATVTPQASRAPPVPERPPARVMSHVAASAPVTARLAPRAPLVTRPRQRAPGALAPHRVSSESMEKSRAVRSRRSRPCRASASDDGPGAEIGLPGALAKAYDAVGDWLVAHPAPAWLVNSPLKTRVTEILAGPSYDPEASLARVKALIASDDVVVFSATYCPFSAAAKAALADAGVPFTAVEWDRTEGGAGFAPALAALTGRSSIPSVWIAGECVGGCNDGNPGVRPLIASGGLDAKLAACSRRVRDARAEAKNEAKNEAASRGRAKRNAFVDQTGDRLQMGLAYAFAGGAGGDGPPTGGGGDGMNSDNLPPEMLEKDPWEGETFEKLGDAVKNWGLFIVVFMAVGAGVVAANTYNDGAAFVDFQDYDSPDQAVAAALKK